MPRGQQHSGGWQPRMSAAELKPTELKPTDQRQWMRFAWVACTSPALQSTCARSPASSPASTVSRTRSMASTLSPVIAWQMHCTVSSQLTGCPQWLAIRAAQLPTPQAALARTQARPVGSTFHCKGSGCSAGCGAPQPARPPSSTANKLPGSEGDSNQELVDSARTGAC